MPFTVSHAAAVAPLARWGLPVPALVIGSVAPDVFTMLPIPSRHGELLGWQWVQKVSDLLGLAVVSAWISLWWRRAPVRPDATVMPLRRRMVAWLAILGPAGVVFCFLLMRDSFYVAITVASGLGVIGLTAVVWMVRRDPGLGQPGSP